MACLAKPYLKIVYLFLGLCSEIFNNFLSKKFTVNNSLHDAFLILRKKQILADRKSVPNSGIENATQIAHIHAMRNSSETFAYNSRSGPENNVDKYRN